MWILLVGFLCLLFVIGLFTGHPFGFTFISVVILMAVGFIFFVGYMIYGLNTKPTPVTTNSNFIPSTTYNSNQYSNPLDIFPTPSSTSTNHIFISCPTGEADMGNGCVELQKYDSPYPYMGGLNDSP